MIWPNVTCFLKESNYCLHLLNKRRITTLSIYSLLSNSSIILSTRAIIKSTRTINWIICGLNLVITRQSLSEITPLCTQWTRVRHTTPETKSPCKVHLKPVFMHQHDSVVLVFFNCNHNYYITTFDYNSHNNLKDQQEQGKTSYFSNDPEKYSFNS